MNKRNRARIAWREQRTRARGCRRSHPRPGGIPVHTGATFEASGLSLGSLPVLPLRTAAATTSRLACTSSHLASTSFPPGASGSSKFGMGTCPADHAAATVGRWSSTEDALLHTRRAAGSQVVPSAQGTQCAPTTGAKDATDGFAQCSPLANGIHPESSSDCYVGTSV